MNIITWIIFGALFGWIASLIVGTDNKRDSLMNVVIGIAGAILGGLLMRAFSSSGVVGLNPLNLLMAIVGAILLLYVARLLRRV